MRQCAICKKGSKLGGKRNLLRAHYNPTRHTRKYPNLQFLHYKGKRILVCSGCRKKLVKQSSL